MTDERIDQGGYENDLRDAENAMAAAGHPDIALGMRRHSEAQRNMMQGVLVPMFVQFVEKSLGLMIAPLVEGQERTHSGIAALSGQFQTLAETVSDLQSAMRESQDDRRVIHEELAGVKDQLTTYIRGSRRGELEAVKVTTDANAARLDLFEKKVAADIQSRLERDDTRLTTLEERGAELQAIRAELKEARELLKALSERLGEALPTEADQALSAELRAAHGDG